MLSSKTYFRRKKTFSIIIVLVALVLMLRLILPFVVLRLANNNLATMNGYYGHIKDIDIALIRGAYQIDSMYLNKVDDKTQIQTPFFSAGKIDLSVEWKAIFHGNLAGELVFYNPRIRFTKDKVEPTHLRDDSTDFKKLLRDFMPLKVNRFAVENGTIRYIDETSNPKVDIEMTSAFILAQNLRNSYDSAALLPAKVTASATLYEGHLSFNMKMNPIADVPTFDMNTELEHTNLKKLNEFFQAYAKVDVNDGSFGLYAEAAAKNGNFTGYIKPLIQDLDVLGKEDRDDNVLRQMWEGFVGSLGQVFKNQDEDQVATKIPFQGKIENPKTNVWYSILTILKNAFVQALQPAIDNEINIASVDHPKEKKNFFQKVFDGKDDKKR